MAKVKAQVAGGSAQDKEASTVGELASMVQAEGFQAAVNGEPATEEYQLRNNDFVSFARPVKAG